MGLTPLEGLPMGTRCGNIDPAILEFVMDKEGIDIAEMTSILNKKSGVLGISGVSSDFRDLDAAKAQGNRRAGVALDCFNYSIKKFIGAYAAALGGLDALVFTAGIGENNAFTRSEAVKGLEFMGIEIDKDANNKRGTVDITGKNSKVKIFVIPTNEELAIANDTKEIVGKL
jgi:acetate kinase